MLLYSLSETDSFSDKLNTKYIKNQQSDNAVIVCVPDNAFRLLLMKRAFTDILF